MEVTTVITLYGLGAGVWLDFGVEDGEPFLEERV